LRRAGSAAGHQHAQDGHFSQLQGNVVAGVPAVCAKYVPKDRLNGLIGEHIMKSLQIDQCWLASVRRWMQSSAAIARPDVGPHCRAHRTTPWKLNPRTALYAGGSSGGFRDDEHPDVSGNARTVFMKLGFGWQSKF
jgi:hypothetical protein